MATTTATIAVPTITAPGTTASTTTTTLLDQYCDRFDLEACYRRGICIIKAGRAICVCDRGFSGKQCQIYHKSKATAVILSIFLGWLGAGRFYIDYYISGSIKLIISLLVVCCFLGLILFSVFSDSRQEIENAMKIGIFVVTILLAIIIIDPIIISNLTHDGLGNSLD